MSGKITGFTETTPQNLTTGAAVIYKDFDIANDTAATAKDKIVSATSGGVTVGIELDSWYREIDGLPENTVGLFEVEGFKPTVKATLVEIGEAQLMTALGAATATTASGKRVVVPRHNVESTDYPENLTIVTQTKATNEPLIIQIINPLSTEGFELATEYKAGGGMEITWTGNYDPSNLDEPPIKFFMPATTQATTTSSTSSSK